ncbi:MAG: hypothetical protein MJ230_05545 [bacterium]|nr:hypothetical protein [bacterium]
MDKHTQLEHYTKYAGRLGGSTNMSLSNIAGLSSELIPRASLFAQYSDQASSMSAMQNLQMMRMMGRVPITGNPMMDMQIQMSAYNQFKQEALKALKQQEVTVMNEKEKEIQLELNSLQQRLTMKQKQLESYKQLADRQAQEAAPKFT